MRMDFVEITSSTNRLLREKVLAMRESGLEIPEQWALCAGFQTAGRGAGNNRWFSSPGKNVLLSVFFKLDLPASRQFLFNLYFSVATQRFLSKIIPSVKIKWPNDIYVGDRKIAGILIEHSVSNNRVDSTIAGIGINVNEEFFPNEIPNPTSLLLEKNAVFDCNGLVLRYLDELEIDFRMMDLSDENVLREEYKRNLYRMGGRHSFISEGSAFDGIIRDIDSFGRLVIENCADNSLKSYEYKQIKYVI